MVDDAVWVGTGLDILALGVGNMLPISGALPVTMTPWIKQAQGQRRQIAGLRQNILTPLTVPRLAAGPFIREGLQSAIQAHVNSGSWRFHTLTCRITPQIEVWGIDKVGLLDIRYLFALASNLFSDITHQVKPLCVAYSSSNSMNNHGSRHLFEMKLPTRFSLD